MAGLKGSMYYSYAFKMRVVESVLSGEECLESASRRFGINGHSTIAKWIRKLEDSNVDLILKKKQPFNYELRIKELEEALAFEKLRSRAYEEMIKIAESEHKISIKKKARYQTIEKMRALYPSVGLGQLCQLFGLSRQAYYDFIKRSMRNKLRDEQLLIMVKNLRAIHPRMGTRKIYEVLQSDMETQGIHIGRDRLFNLLSDNQLLIRRRKRKVRTTNSYHHFNKYSNLIKGFTPYKSNQVWVSDITYIKLEQSYCYLFLITDAYSRKVVGYELSRDLRTSHAVKALEKAIMKCKSVEGLVHHSDRGIQYCSHQYVKLCQDYEIKLSMTESGNPLDNAIAERINGILKEEYINVLQPKYYEDLKSKVDQVVYRYNQLRPHLSCDMMTPNQAHTCQGKIQRRWKNNYKSIS